MIVSLVRFRSALSDEDVQTTFEGRADGFRSMPGLVEKLYLRFRETGEYGAVYVWESEEDLRRFRETDLARTIPDAYRVHEVLGFEVADVRLVLRPQTPRRAISI